MKISIADEVYSISPRTALGVLSYRATVVPGSQELAELFEDVVATLF